MAEIVVTQAESGRSVTAAIGDQIKIELPENPTTGFRWEIVSRASDVLGPPRDDYVASPAAGVGGGGMRVFRFDVAGAGAAEVRMELKRSWEAQAPRATFTTRVTVAR
jgi:inhibitor of cysteine peptidase